MGDPEAVVQRIRRGAGIVSPTTAPVKTGTGLDQHRHIEAGRARGTGRGEDAGKTIRGRLGIDDANVTQRIGADGTLIRPLARAAINHSRFSERGHDIGKSVYPHFIEMNNGLAGGAAGGVAEPDRAVLPESVALRPLIKGVNGDRRAGLRRAGEGGRTAVVGNRHRGRSERPRTQRITQRPHPQGGANKRGFSKIGHAAGTAAAHHCARLQREPPARSARRIDKRWRRRAADKRRFVQHRDLRVAVYVVEIIQVDGDVNRLPVKTQTRIVAPVSRAAVSPSVLNAILEPVGVAAARGIGGFGHR